MWSWPHPVAVGLEFGALLYIDAHTMAEAGGAAEASRDARGRHRLQNYQSVAAFLPTSVWAALYAAQAVDANAVQQVEALSSLMQLCLRLGLQYPSEATYARLFVLTRYRHGFPNMLESEINAQFTTCKGKIKAAMTRLQASTPSLVPYCTDLPQTPQGLAPDTYAEIYGRDPLPDTQVVPEATLNVLQGMFRLRLPRDSGSRTNLEGLLSAAGLLPRGTGRTQPQLTIFPHAVRSGAQASSPPVVSQPLRGMLALQNGAQASSPTTAAVPAAGSFDASAAVPAADASDVAGEGDPQSLPLVAAPTPRRDRASA